MGRLGNRPSLIAAPVAPRSGGFQAAVFYWLLLSPFNSKMGAMLRILLVGAKGRMGQAIGDEAGNSQTNLTIAHRCQRGDPVEDEMSNIDIVIDVSHPDAADALCSACTKNRIPLVIGTTGHTAEQRNTIEKAARSIPVVLASNFSIGVNALFALTRRAAEMLGNEFDPKIIETHHRMKKDAPSGTAKTIAEILREDGNVGEIPIESIREGEIVGQHTVIFAGPGERLQLTHHAENRAIFARGALRAARWIVGQPPGLYSMQDVLGM
jgi:4-hydroxy-tetrahydrodipicolinate reductase